MKEKMATLDPAKVTVEKFPVVESTKKAMLSKEANSVQVVAFVQHLHKGKGRTKREKLFVNYAALSRSCSTFSCTLRYFVGNVCLQFG